MASFGLEECGDYGAAEDAARQAIALESDDCWAQHGLCHVMEMQARQEEGIAFIEGRQAHWAQDENAFAFHNWWHVSLFNLDNDRFERVLEIYDAAIRPGNSEVQLEMLDAAALLWRLHLRGVDTGGRYEALAATYKAQAAEHGFYAFNDMHAAMAYVATGRERAAEALEQAVLAAAEGAGTNARMSREVGLPIVCAIRAFGAGRYGEAADLLMPVRYRAQVFGGSHAIDYRQEDVAARVADLVGGEGLAVAYDSVARDTAAASVACLRPGGRLVLYGASSDAVPQPVLAEAAAKRVTVVRPGLFEENVTPAALQARTEALFVVLESGAVAVHIDRRYPLAEAAGAHRDIEARRTTGESVLVPT